MLRFCGRVFVVLGLMLASVAAHAVDGYTYGGPVEGTDFGSAYLPPTPGVYGSLVLAFPSASGFYGNNSKIEEPLQFGIHGTVALQSLMYVYPFKIFGGTIASAASFYQTISRTATTFGESVHASGFGDTYVDLLSWSKYLGSADPLAHGRLLPYGLTVKLGYAMVFPTGKYDPQSTLTSVGFNVYQFEPHASLTYLTGPNFLGDGTEFSTSVFYSMSSTNPATGYHSAPGIDVDWAISERIGWWQAGILGNYASQLGDDRLHGVGVPNVRLGVSMLGAAVSYTVPQWKTLFKLKATHTVWARNYARATMVFLQATKGF